MYEVSNDKRRFFKGDVYWVNFPEAVGSIQSGIHPAIITSNNTFNKYAPVLQVSSITSKYKESPVHVGIGVESGLEKQSWILVEQDTTIAKELIGDKIGRCNYETLIKVEEALLFQKGIDVNKFIKIEPFNINVANKYIEKIIRLNRIVKKLEISKMLSSDDLIERESLINEFKEYCQKHEIDANIFYKKQKQIVLDSIKEQQSVAK